MRGPSDLVYGAYERQLARSLPTENLPRHVGVMLDGNRRWAKLRGHDTQTGHRAGADNIKPFLGWCEEVGVEVVTLWLLSTDNLRRDAAELGELCAIIGDTISRIARKLLDGIPIEDGFRLLGVGVGRRGDRRLRAVPPRRRGRARGPQRSRRRRRRLCRCRQRER